MNEDNALKYGRYLIKQEQGRGSMGIVYKARDSSLDRIVAVKVLRKDLANNKAYRERFLKEAKAIARLSHPHIITVFDINQDEEDLYIVMEYIEGPSLDKVLIKEQPSFQKIVDLGIQVAEAIDSASQMGVVHRDIKPSNLLIKSNWEVKITDFGVAHIEDSSSHGDTKAGTIVGTLGYMPPEQLNGKHADIRSDLYSLGAVLYELCTGEKHSYDENVETMKKKISLSPSLTSTTNKFSMKKLTQIIMKCMKEDPENRFQTGFDLAAELKSCLEEEQLQEQEQEENTIISIRSEGKKIRKYSKILLLIMVSIVAVGIMYNTVRKKEEAIPPSTTGMPFESSGPPDLKTTLSSILDIKSIPIGAKVYIDRKYKGTTPLKLKLSPGRYEVKLTLSYHNDWRTPIILKEKSTLPLFVKLIANDKNE